MISGRLNLFQTAFLCVFLFVFLRAGRLDDHADAARFRGGFHTGFGAAVDGVNLGFGVVRDDRTFGHIAAALYFGIAGQGNEVGCGRIRHGIGLAVDHAFAAVQLLAEFDGRAGGFHQLLAFVVARNGYAAGADIERALFDDDVAGKGGALVVLVKRALVGFDLNRLLAVALQGKGRAGGKNGNKG